MKKPSKTTLRNAAADQLNAEGRISPLQLFQERLEHHRGLAFAELDKGDAADLELVQIELKLAQEAADALAPYRHPRLQASAVINGTEDDLTEFLKSIDGLTRGTNYGKKVLN